MLTPRPRGTTMVIEIEGKQWVLVPVELTNEMLADTADEAETKEAWRYFLSIAPKQSIQDLIAKAVAEERDANLYICQCYIESGYSLEQAEAKIRARAKRKAK